MKIAIIFIIAYLIGAIPNGYIISKKFYNIDIRKYGSGNIGMTNVQRVIGTKPAVFVFMLDFLEGAVTVLLGRIFLHSVLLSGVAGLFATLGHIYSIFMPHLRGGKGVATSLGTAIFIAPIPALLSIVTFSIVLFLFKYMSLGSILGAISFPLSLFAFGSDYRIVILGFILASLVIISHRDNIKRLIEGSERKIGEKVKVDKISEE